MNLQSSEDVKIRIASVKDALYCTNAAVIHHSFQCVKTVKRKKVVAFTQLAEHLISKYSKHPVSLNLLLNKLRRTINHYNSLILNIKRNSILIDTFLKEEFVFPSLDTVEPPQASAQQPHNLFCGQSTSNAESAPSSPPAKRRVLTHVTTPVKTRRDCENCSGVKKANSSLRKSLKLLKTDNGKLKKFTSNVKKSLNFRVQKQKLTRHGQKINDQKCVIRNLLIQLRHTEIRLSKVLKSNDELIKEKDKLLCENSKLIQEISQLKSSLKSEIAEHNNLKRYSQNIELTLKDAISKESESRTDGKITIKTGKSYTPDIRKMVYQQLTCDVPVKNCGHIISAFFSIFLKKELNSVPSPASCAQMAYELGVITTIQLMEHMLNNSAICLSWDATTVDGAHINEIHLTVNKTECLSLDVRHIAGGKTADYVSHIVSALTEAADLYARYVAKPQQEIFSELKARISCTLTDRAAVNACVTRQLCEELDSQLLQLNCNIHPLDSVARRAKQQLARLDESWDIKGSCFGTDGCATNLINAVSVLRFKDGSGDPAGFKDMLHRHNLPVGTFVRYVGNRMHVLFHLAGILVLHCNKVKDFLDTRCTAGGLLRSRLLKDLRNDRIMAQVWALGIIGKVFTGPWMSKFYSSEMSNLEMRPLVQKSEELLQTWKATPELLFSPASNAFGEPLSPDSDSVLSGLHCFVSGEDEIQLEALKSLLQACLDVLHSQLGIFITDPEPSSEMLQRAESAPTHNMASERTLGSLDKMLRRAPVATGGFLNGKVRAKINKCLAWLDRQSPNIQDKVITFAISEARLERVKRCTSDKKVIEEIDKRRGAVAAERSVKDKKRAMKVITKCFKDKCVETLECAPAVREKVKLFVQDPDSILGLSFLHTRDNCEFYGRIHCLEGSDTASVGYWGVGESECSSVDQTVSICSFFAEAISGSIIFL